MSAFAIATLSVYALVMLYVSLTHGRFFVVFIGVTLAVHALSSVALYPALARGGALVQALLWYGQAATFLYFGHTGRMPMPPKLYHVLVSWPAAVFSAGVFLGLPWAITVALGFSAWAPWLPFAAALFGLTQSLWTRNEHRRIVLDGRHKGDLARDRHGLRRSPPRRQAPVQPQLKLVQISDPHLGPFMSVARLRRICTRAVAEQPDLILLTGDFLTMESQRSPEPLARALAPLEAMKGRTFACFGNHDHECPDLVRAALQHAHVELLVDRAIRIDTRCGPVQIVGADHHWRARREALGKLAATFPREPDALRLWLLHDPGAFVAIPEGEADLVLSGHTHGGHLGLLSFGLTHTVVSAATRMPDHGLWARGRDRLYVHRGTGHYGFPLRIGVPAEESVIEVQWLSPLLPGSANERAQE